MPTNLHPYLPLLPRLFAAVALLHLPFAFTGGTSLQPFLLLCYAAAWSLAVWPMRQRVARGSKLDLPLGLLAEYGTFGVGAALLSMALFAEAGLSWLGGALSLLTLLLSTVRQAHALTEDDPGLELGTYFRGVPVTYTGLALVSAAMLLVRVRSGVWLAGWLSAPQGWSLLLLQAVVLLSVLLVAVLQLTDIEQPNLLAHYWRGYRLRAEPAVVVLLAVLTDPPTVLLLWILGLSVSYTVLGLGARQFHEHT